MSINIAVVGATGNVGREMLSILASKKFDSKNIFPVASSRSEGSEATIGTIVVVLTCNLITPSYVGSFFNASVIGIILSLGIELAPSQETKS